MFDQKIVEASLSVELESRSPTEIKNERNSLLYRMQSDQAKSRQTIAIPVSGTDKNDLPINIDPKSRIYSQLSQLIRRGYFIEAERKDGQVVFSIRHLTATDKTVSTSLYADNKTYGAGNYRDAGSFMRLLEFNLGKQIKGLLAS